MYHTLTLVGNLGREPEMRYLPDGTAVTNLNIATNRSWNGSDGQKVSETTWFRVSVWGKQAEACNEYLQKGRRVLVEGRLKPDGNGGPRVFTRNDGTAGASFEVTADKIVFLGGGNGNGQAADSEPAAQEEDQIPF